MGRRGGGGGKGKGGTSPERFGFGAMLGVLMFAPAAVLVWHGNLSVNDAIVRFGLAWTVAVVGVGVVVSALSAPAPRPAPTAAEPTPPRRDPEEPATPAVAEEPAAS
ncbi:hypothetical protein [Phycicoccus avicenniae]|uniref:hypothetical protein n=1 Tax=Phycicoccus avicenniae TaxID=2828860 RepID=UPI003D283458